MRLTVVGCSGSVPQPGAAASCYLIEADDVAGRRWRVVLDLGSGALGPLQLYAPLRELDAVCLSHLHPDHFLDVCPLLVALYYDPNTPGAIPAAPRLAVYGPADTARRIELAYAGEPVELVAEVFDVRPWIEGAAVTVGPLTITARRVNHPIEAYGLRVEHEGGGSMAYTGDSDSCPALLDLAADVDLLLAEASYQDGRDLGRDVHLTGHRAGRLAAQAGARGLVLTHIPAWTDPAVVLEHARGAYRGSLTAAAPGVGYDI